VVTPTRKASGWEAHLGAKDIEIAEDREPRRLLARLYFCPECAERESREPLVISRPAAGESVVRRPFRMGCPD
jgi:hypothetical protein